MPAEEYATAYESPSTARKVLNRAANPMTTLGYVVRGQDIPDRVPDKGNPIDIAAEVVNPAAWADYAVMSGEALGRGDYVGAGLNALASIPAIPSAVKAAPKVLQPAVDLFHPVGRDLRRIKRQGARKGLSPMEIKQQQMREVGITSQQRKGYFPGVSELVTEYYTPYGYEHVLGRLKDIPTRIIKGEKNRKVLTPDVATWVNNMQTGQGYKNALGTIQSVTKPRYDAWRMYSGMPQEFGTFRVAETLPVNHPSYSSKQLANLERFSINDELELLKDSQLPSLQQLRLDYELGQISPERLMNSAGYFKDIPKRLNDFKSKGIRVSNDVSQTNIMGGHNQRFFDDVLEYNDIWDLHPGGFHLEDFYGKPFLSHGRIPYAIDDILKENKKVVDRIEHLEKTTFKDGIKYHIDIPGIQHVSGNSPGGRLRGIIQSGKQKKMLGGSLPKAQEGEEKYQPTSFVDYLNPMNWGVSNRDDAGSFDEAFAAARNAGDDEFMWYGNRYNTKLDLTPPEPLKGITNDLLMKQAFVESSFKPKRVSGAGAKGLTQFTDRTVAELRRLNLIDDSFDIYNNADAAKAQKLYMQHIYDRPYIDKEANESEKVRIAKTLAAYNWGPEELRLYLNNKKAEGMNIYDMGEWIDNLPKETREYIGMILLNQPSEGRPQVQENFIKAITGDKYKDIISLYDYDGVRPLGSYQTGGSTYKIKPGDTLSKIANRFGTSVQELVDLNKINDPNLIIANQTLNLPSAQAVAPQPSTVQPAAQTSSIQPSAAPAQNQNVYTVRSGDTLGQIAKAHKTTVKRLAKINNISDPNKIFPNQEIVLPQNFVPIKPIQKEAWHDIDELDKSNRNINQLSDEEIVLKAQTLADPNERFVVVDKKNKMFKYYQGDNVLMEFEIITGKNEGDAQTVTKAIDINNDGIITDADRVDGEFKVDWSMGNLNTGAGKYTIDQSMATTDYGGYYQYAPSFTLLNERGTPIGTAIHGTPKYREKFFGNNILDDNRQSSGCINGKCTDIQALYDMGLAKGTSVYILPEEAGNRFEFVDGQAVLRMSKENREKYTGAYTDEKGREQTGQGGNYSVNTLKYKPIRPKFDEKTFKEKVFQSSDNNDEQELAETTMPFINALVENKQAIMKEARIPGDVYNQIARMAFGIYGTESNFGDTHSGAGNFLRALNKFSNRQNASSPDVVSKYYTYNQKADNNSVGYTQIRWSFLNDDEKKALSNLGITSNEDFLDPSKSAIATAAVLGIRYNQQLKPSQKRDMWKHLPGKWNNRKNYSDRVFQNSRYLTFEQLDKLQTGGEINHLDMYSGYVQGKYDGTEDEKSAKDIYDKLNRVYYNEAKLAGTSVPNYIMSYMMDGRA